MFGSWVWVKIWSWFVDDKQEIRQGGFVGWLIDGILLWVIGSGISKMVLICYVMVFNWVLLVLMQVVSG